MAIRLEVHLEWAEHAIRLPEDWQGDHQWTVVDRLLGVLDRSNGIAATFYTLGPIAKSLSMTPRGTALLDAGYRFGSHGYYHRHGEREGDAADFLTRQYLPHCDGYRSPFWDTTPRPGMAGGVFFRTLPYAWLKHEVQKQHVLFLHPHDLEYSGVGGEPDRRSYFFCNPWERLERLLTEVDFERR